jgi:hypothetical protein
VGFEEKLVEIEVFADGAVTLEMEEIPMMMDEIVIRATEAEKINHAEIGLTELSVKELKRAPALLGETDIIKQIQLLPGVTSVGEAASGFNVRGGSVDQNLVLYDDMPVFNSSHVFGFFSSFNAEAVRDVSFYKGGMPAEYGGRASSILNMRSTEGSLEKWGLRAGIGLISSNLLAEGPVRRGKSSVALSFRSTYSDWLLKTIPKDYLDLSSSSVSFYDGTFKFTHASSPRSKVTTSLYRSHDSFTLLGDSAFSWNTTIASVRWDQQLSSSLNMSVATGLGAYRYGLSEPSRETGFSLEFGVVYPSVKLDFITYKGSHKLGFGSQLTYYAFRPGVLEPNSPDSNRPFLEMEEQRTYEAGFYIQDHFALFTKLHIDFGLRLSAFRHVGPGTVFLYQTGASKEVATITDTLSFSGGEKMAGFQNWEPRLGLRFDVGPASSVKFAYHRVYQYLHLVTNSTAMTPVDIWQPSGYYFKPQQADQVSIGYFRSANNKYDASVETYYKRIKNILDFKDGAQLILNPQLETDLLQGKAETYGIETQLSKKTGRLVGSASYTYSRSFYTFDGIYPGESINDGNRFPANFDQPHIVNLGWKYSLSKRIFFTGGFTYHTGRPISLPLSAFYVDNTTVTSFSNRNEFRIPDYHRLDLGLVIEGNHKRRKLFDGTWNFSIYNVYARRNAYTVYFQEVKPGILRPYRLSIIGTAIPSLSYSLKI